MTTTQFIVLILIFAVFTVLIAHMVNYTWSYSANYTLNDCAMMFFGDDWRGGFNTALAKWCNNITEWKEMISKY